MAPASVLNETGSISTLLRVGSMLDSVLEELNESLDEPAAQRAAGIFNNGLGLLREAMSDEITAEMSKMVLDISGSPSVPTLRVAFRQLTGWLGGVVSSELTANANPLLSLLASQAQGEEQVAEVIEPVRLPGMYL